MSDDINPQTDEQEEEEDIFKMLGLTGDEEYDDEQDEADEEIAKEDKMAKKLSAKMDNMQKKFEATMIRERITSFEKDASELELGLFKTVAADVKDMESLDKAMRLVHERAAQMTEEAEKYREQLEQQAQQQVAKAWGTTPGIAPKPRTKDYNEELMKKVAAGDVRAAFEAVVGDDIPLMNR